MIHHKTPLKDLFARMRIRLSSVFQSEMERMGVTLETANQNQKNSAFAVMDREAMKMLKQIDYNNHPEIKNG